MKQKIAMYNFLTVIFAILTFVTVGSLAVRADLFTCVVLLVLFAHLAYTCYNKESELRAIMRKRRRVARAKARDFKVVRGTKHSGRKVA